MSGLLWTVELCKLLDQNLTIQATKSTEQYSRSTVFNVLRARRSVLLQISFGFLEIAFCPVNCTNLTTFYLQQPMILKKLLQQALHCPSYSTYVTRSLQIHRYWTLLLVQKKKKRYLTALITSVQVHGESSVRMHSWMLCTNWIP